MLRIEFTTYGITPKIMVSLAGFEPAPNRVGLYLAGWAIRFQSGGVYQFRDRDKVGPGRLELPTGAFEGASLSC